MVVCEESGRGTMPRFLTWVFEWMGWVTFAENKEQVWGDRC